MAYGLIYQGEFSSIADNDYRLEILKKDYTGGFTTLVMAGKPAVQNWGTDEIKPAVKGCNLSINYLNRGSDPIENFYSNNNDEFKVIFYQSTNILFVGFLVQDDIGEPMLDYTHEVQLSATDNLGLLKDIVFDKYPLTATAFNPTTAQGDFISILLPPQNWIYLRNSSYAPVVGTPFTISGHPVNEMNQTFIPTVVNVVSAGNYDIRTNTFTGDTAAEPVYINGVGGTFDFYERSSLLSCIAVCLQNTGLELNTYIYENLYEEVHNTSSSSLAQTYISLQTFISGDVFQNCFEVLTNICDRFNLTLFQSLGRWNIIRWDELRLGSGINGFIYNDNFVLTGTTTLNAGMTFGFQEDTYPETGLSKSGVRPFEFVKETFNYVQPKYLLKNYDLLKLGYLLRTIVNATEIFKEYVAINWQRTSGEPIVAERFIRVVTDLLGNEIQRFLVIRGNTSNTILCVPSEEIECNVGDKIKFSFSTRTNISQPAPFGAVFGVRLTDGVSNRYVDELPVDNGTWQPTVGFNYSITGDTINWNSIEIASSRMPFTGKLACFLAQNIRSPYNINRETYYKDMRFEYTAFINDSTKIIGHIHKDIQDVVIKNNEETEIYIDDSPSNAVQGTLFRNLLTGLVQQRTALWHRDGVVESKKLGEITTREQLQWRSFVRTRLDGSLRGLIQSGNNLSMLNHFEYAQLPGLNFLFGNLQIDYRNDKLTCSATELYKTGEAEVAKTYSFTYIYDTK